QAIAAAPTHCPSPTLLRSRPQEPFAELRQQLDKQNWHLPAGDILAGLLAPLAATDLPEASFKTLEPAIEQHFSHASIPAIRGSLAAEQRPEYRDWAAETLSIIDSRSPLA